MLRFQLYRPALIAVCLLVFAIPAACGTLQLGVEKTPLETPQVSGVNVEGPTPSIPGTEQTEPEAQGVDGTVIPSATATPVPDTEEEIVNRTATAQTCENFPLIEGQQALPDLSDLHWEAAETEAGVLYRLAGLSAPVISAVASPDGHWFALKLVRRLVQGGPAETATYIIDSSGEGHWLASAGGQEDLHDFAWLQDGRLLWVDSGSLILGTNTGMERRDLAVPEPVYEVWAAAQNVIFASGKVNLWRLNLNGGTWELVMGLEDAMRGGPSLISRPMANLSIAPDGSFAAVNIAGSLYRIPIESGYPARRVGIVEYAGKGARIDAPRPLANSPYWYPGEMPLYQTAAQPFSAVLLDERNGRLVPLAELINIRDQAVHSPVISPDGQWVAVPLSESTSTAGEELSFGEVSSIYLARTDNLGLGRIFSGNRVAGWLNNPVGVFIRQSSRTNTTLSSVLLPDGRIYPLFSNPDPYLPLPVQATSRLAFVGASNQVHAILPDGLQLASVDIYDPKILSALPPARGLFSGFTTQAIGGGQCSFMPALFLWDIR